MVNPFEKRATEYLRDDEAFLAVVTPEPLLTFFKKPAREGRLFDRLSFIVGTPGSGKTTLARLFQFQTIRTLLRNEALATYRPLVDALVECGVIENQRPTVVGGRLPLEAEYRELWEFPYPEELKTALMIGLLQARTVLAWLRSFVAAGVPLADVEIVPRADAEAALTAIGGSRTIEVQEKARAIELAIYNISAALVPPDISDFEAEAVTAYRPFDVIESFRVSGIPGAPALRPLVIFDDAHILHPAQLAALRHWLARRELKVARWVLTRLDALTPSEVLTEKQPDESAAGPGLKRSREITFIRLQSSDERSNQRRAFRKMAKDMASRYLGLMEVFSRRRLHSLADLLSTAGESITSTQREGLARHVTSLQRRHGVSQARRTSLEADVATYLRDADDQGEDLHLAMLGILFSRYAKRTPQRDLFEGTPVEPEPNRPLTVDASIADGARIHLLHRYGRPYFYGIDALCDASSENAEHFLQLSARLVSQSETQLVRSKQATLSSALQHSLLRERAGEMLRDWDFPQQHSVLRLADAIARLCIKKSLEANASLGGGASAIGIPQDEFDQIPSLYPELARVLHYGVAYNALILVPNYGTKKRVWCLIELGGTLLLHYGLTLKRGGFLEKRTQDLVRMLGEA